MSGQTDTHAQVVPFFCFVASGLQRQQRVAQQGDRVLDATLVPVDVNKVSPSTSKANELLRQGGAMEKLRRVSESALQGVETEAALTPLHDVVQGQRVTDDSLHDINELFKEISKESKSPAPSALVDLEKVREHSPPPMLPQAHRRGKELSRGSAEDTLRELEALADEVDMAATPTT
jgi:hypothetical protein